MWPFAEHMPSGAWCIGSRYIAPLYVVVYRHSLADPGLRTTTLNDVVVPCKQGWGQGIAWMTSQASVDYWQIRAETGAGTRNSDVVVVPSRRGGDKGSARNRGEYRGQGR